MKRAMDVVLAATLLLLLSPLLLLLAVLVRVKLGRPVIFRQVRPGLGGRPFTIYKFRSMIDGKDEAGHDLPDAERLTSFGRKLRALSLDELPELWNVLKGDMSLVGPRPLRMEYLSRYTAHQARRHEVKPGITGLAQIGGRNSLSWEDKFALDIEYVDSHNPWLDLKILARTVASVVTRHGITHRDYSTMPEYLGPEGTEDGR